MKISTLVFLGFLVILVMFSITTYINFRLADQVHENSEYFVTSTVVVRSSNRFQRNIINMVSGLRGYLVSGEQYFLQAYDSSATENITLFQDLDALVLPGTPQKRELNEIKKTYYKWINEHAAPLLAAKKDINKSDSLQNSSGPARSSLPASGEFNLSNALNTRIRNFTNHEYNAREKRKEALENTIRKTRQVSIILTSFSILTGLFIAAYLANTISRRIKKLVAMANNIAAGNYDVYQDSSNDELSKLTKSLNEMSQVLSENISLLKRKNSELAQFAHIVSHDLKAPLRGIDNVVTWIEEDHMEELTPKVKEYVGLIKSRIIRGENLIRGILSYSRIGQHEIEKEEVDLNQMMDDILENMVARPEIKISIQPNLPVMLTERVPLMQVFTNLISNAIKYNDKPAGEVKVYYKEDVTHYTFFVEDNGPGIGRNYHEKIFIIFQTLNGTDTFENTGVGLAIVKKILDDKKQKITLSSELGKGTVFEFTWPKE